jgi:ABC-type glutathione transport system ATPase component
MSTTPVLSVRDLCISYARGNVAARQVSFELAPGRIVALVGPSGSGKSSIALALLGLLPGTARVSGSIVHRERAFDASQVEGLSVLRGRAIGWVPQDPLAALDPSYSVLEQVASALRICDGVPAASARERALAWLGRLGVEPAAELGARAPHALSGGQRQRVLLATALARSPDVLVLDEPTSALDLPRTIELLALLRGLARAEGTAVLWITHDLRAARALADECLVLREGRIVARGAAEALAHEGENSGELAAVGPGGAVPVLRVTGLTVRRGARPRWGRGEHGGVEALADVGLELGRGEVLSVVGASGSGKSTLLAALLGLVPRAAGSVELSLANNDEPVDPARASRGQLGALRRRVGLVLQDPGSSLNPRLRVEDALLEALEVRRRQEANLDEVRSALVRVGLGEVHLRAWPHELSGGERQRVALARALCGSPALLLCDEVLSSLDPETAAAMLCVLKEAVRLRGTALCMVTHDLAVARALGGRMAVLHEGRVVEEGPVEELLARPQHPHTAALATAYASLER